MRMSNMVVFFLRLMKIPTQKGEHSSKCTELSLKRKEGKSRCILTHHSPSLSHLLDNSSMATEVRLSRLPKVIPMATAVSSSLPCINRHMAACHEIQEQSDWLTRIIHDVIHVYDIYKQYFVLLYNKALYCQKNRLYH